MGPDNANEAEVSTRAIGAGYLANVLAAVREHPTRIGRYHIEQLIGEGGMGTVYRAEQREPIRRTVAVKLIKLGMDTRQVIARFESERQALALMDHPNVARVIDAGATDTGRPYFVMEYVEGQPITAFADEQELTIRQRLELFMQACDAVQHAHQKAIIHRDLKPSNILVTQVDGKPQVKVIDFGVAKAISQRLTERTMFTESGQLMGTPEYMSPEQADAVELDTRTDVYSLGVVLYELLAGALPFDPTELRSRGYQEIQRIIRETEPPRPSSRLTKLGADAREVARRRHTPLASLTKLLKSELEWIPLKAMRKDRGQRYATAAELSEDIGNYLENRPLRAGPESRVYRARTFLRRNKAGVTASVAMLLLLTAGIVATSWQAVRATRAQRATRAALVDVQHEKKKVEAASVTVSDVNHFLVNMLAQANPYQSKGERVTVKEVLDASAGQIDTGLGRQPLAEAAIRNVLAASYTQLGRPDLALPHARAAVEIRRRLLGNDHADTLASIGELAFNLKKLGRLGEAEPLCREAEAGCRRVLGEDDPTTLTMISNLAVLMCDSGRAAEAVPMLRSVLEKRRHFLGDEHSDTYQSLNNLGSALRSLNQLAEAESLYREALGRPRSALGADHPDTLKILFNLGVVLQLQGKLDDAERLLRESLERSRRVLGDEHVDTLNSIEQLASLLQDQGKVAEAEPMYRQALETARRTLGPDHFSTLTFEHNLAALMKDQGKLDEAEAMFRDVLERRRRVMPANHPAMLGTMHHLASIIGKRGRLAEAEAAMREVAELRRQAMGPDHPDTLASVYGLVLLLRDQGKLADAEAVCRELVGGAKRGMGQTHPNTLSTMMTLASLLQSQQKLAESESLYRDVHEARRARFGEGHPATLASQDSLIVVLGQQKKWDEAVPLAKLLYDQMLTAPASKLSPQVRARYLSQYGMCLARMGRSDEAIQPLTEARAALHEAGDGIVGDTQRVLGALADCCANTSRPEDAARWRAELQSLQASTRPASKPAATRP